MKKNWMCPPPEREIRGGGGEREDGEGERERGREGGRERGTARERGKEREMEYK